MIEFKNYRVSFSAVNTWVIYKILIHLSCFLIS